jgi:uncharacterized protein (TIGR02453 family)
MASSGIGFSGWPAEALEFYEGLEADNSKTYWTANKSAYDELVLAPMTALMQELGPEFGEWKIFRPYRDVRFSADKTPYKTQIAARIGSGYVQLSVDGLGAGAGYFHLMTDQLARYRDAVDDDKTGAELEQIIAAVGKKSVGVIGREMLKKAPRGYPTDHPRIELLRHKGLVTWQQWEVEPWLGTSAAKKKIADFFRTSVPLVDWLDKNVGESRSERE